MPPRSLPLALLAALVPSVAPAGPPAATWVSNLAVCAALRGGAALEDAVGDLDALILEPSGYSGMEFRCSFDPPLDLNAPDGTTTTHVGYCEEPGFITPQLFTFRMDRQDSPRLTLYDGGDTPMEFFACP